MATSNKKPAFSMKMIDFEAYKENRLELPPEGWEWDEHHARGVQGPPVQNHRA